MRRKIHKLGQSVNPITTVGQLKYQVIYRQPACRKLIVQIRRITNQRDTTTGKNIDNMALRTAACQPLNRRIDRYGTSAMTAAGVGYTKKDAGGSVCAHVGLLDDFAWVCPKQNVRSPICLIVADW